MTPNQLPPLPPAAHRGPDGTGAHFDSFTAAQMHAYALAALAQQAQEPVYQVRGAFDRDPVNTWRDTTETAFYFHPANARRILYTAPQPQPAPPVPAPVDEREAFEATMRAQHGWGCKDFAIDDDGGYLDGHTATAWSAWRDRAILALRPQAVPMTDEQRALIIGRAADKTADRSAAALYAICETERLYGITAKAEGGAQ